MTKPSPPTTHKSLHFWRKAIKTLSITAVSIVALLTIALTLLVWIMTPSRLTPLACDVANRNIRGTLAIERVELSFWSTFPHLTLEVDSLQLVSHSLPDSIRTTLGTEADSLLCVEGLSASINPFALLRGHIALGDVDITRPRINLVQVNDSTSNFAILPQSDQDTDTTTRPLDLPSITLHRFALLGGFPVRYRSLSQGIDFTILVKDTHLAGESQPLYTLRTEGNLGALLPDFRLPDTPFGINGAITWQPGSEQIQLEGITLSVDKLRLTASTDIDLANGPTVKSFSASIPRTDVTDVLSLIPAQYATAFKGLDTDATVECSATLQSPLRLDAPQTQWPKADASIKLQASKIKYQQLHLNKFLLDAAAQIDLADNDLSVIDFRYLSARGQAVDCTLKGTVRYPLSDPLISATFDGMLDMARLPHAATASLPATLSGTLRGHATLHSRLSYLTPRQFHRLNASGTLDLNDFRMHLSDGTADAYLHHASLDLGTASHVRSSAGQRVDSMLTARLQIDTMALTSPGIVLSGRSLSAAVGAKNTTASADTSRIIPLGISVKAQRLYMLSDSDSVRMRLHQCDLLATLRQFSDKGRAPLLDLNLSADRARYADRFNRASLREAAASFTLHPRLRARMNQRSRQRFDSIAAKHPDISTDSINALLRADRRARRKLTEQPTTGADRHENIDLQLDQSATSLLRTWQAQGHVSARRVRVFTPYFPTRISLKGLAMDFSTDSVTLHNTLLKVGRSDFKINGSISNLRRALTSRRHAPLSLNFASRSDTIDVNDLTATMLRGAVFAEQIQAGTYTPLPEADSDESLQQTLDQSLDTTQMAPVLIPYNIRAKVSIGARHMLYNDVDVRRLVGALEVYDGALSLDRLRGSTDMGSLSLTALYTAPTPSDISFAAAMQLKKLRLRSLLDMMPQVDSLLPMLSQISGVVNADAAMVTSIDSTMNIDIPTLNMALKLSGDSLVLMDSQTFRTVAKWMMFKQKQRNMIDHMAVEIGVHNGYIDVYPFIFDMDRYRIGVQGSNDAALNLDYHVAVIKSPIPFRFGINIKGTPQKLKIRLGGAKINEKSVASTTHIADDARINLVKEITNVFRRGVRTAGTKGLELQQQRRHRQSSSEPDAAFTHADSLILIREGLIEAHTPTAQ